jgi:hypothetical protein
LPIEKVGGGDSKAGHPGEAGLRRDVPDLHEMIGVLERQGLKQDSVYNAEDGGVGADAQGHDEDGNGGESGAFEQMPNGEFQILQESGHNATSALAAN